MADTGTTAYHIWRMGETSMRRARSIRTIRELEEDGGEVGEDGNLEDYRNELASVGNNWEVRRGGGRVETKSPLLNNDERRRRQNPTPTRCGDWVLYGPDMRRGYLYQAHDIPVAGALKSAASRKNSLLSRAHGPAGNDILQIRDRSPAPTPSVEREEERRGKNVTPEAIPRNNRSVSEHPPPAL